MYARLLMIKLNHNNVKVVADPRAEDVTKIFAFKVSRYSKTQNNNLLSRATAVVFLPQVCLSSRQAQETCLVSLHLTLRVPPSPHLESVRTEGSIGDGVR